MFKLTKIQKEQIRKIAKKYGIELVVLFGSTARGETHSKSDIDIAIKTIKPFSYYDEAVAREDFCKIFKRVDIEVLALNNIRSPLLLKFIATEGKVLYEKKSSIFAEFQIYALRLYYEAKQLFALEEKQLQERLKTI